MVALATAMRHLVASLIALAACGTGPATQTGTDAGTPVDAGPMMPPGFTPLVIGNWTLQPGEQKYVCVRLTLHSDVWISKIDPVAPTGTHHQVLMVGDPAKDDLPPDGTVDCDSSLTEQALFGAGLGTQELDIPDGIALHIAAGQQLLLNLHLFNPNDTVTMTGSSGIAVMTVDPSLVQHEAGTVLAGKAQGLTVLPGKHDQVGTCSTGAGETIVAVAPHMHLLGAAMKVTYTDGSGANVTVLDDEDYSFDNQQYTLMSPMLTTAAGGTLTVDCTYVNDTGQTVYFGEYTQDEMCFAITMAYPPPSKTICTQ